MHPTKAFFKILVVDDEAHTRDALKRTLHKDFEIFEAENAKKALEWLQTHPDIAVVISDERMPGMSGIEMLSQIKESYPKIIRVILSGQIELDDMVKAVNEASVHRFILKPWDNSFLKIQLHEALAHHKDLGEMTRLGQLAITDPVTGLTNHRFFQERIKQEAERSLRHDRQFSLIMIDVDHFKSFNDKFGHPAGDKALFKLAQILKKATRHADTVSRYGGEEFAMILPETTKEAALEVAERIRAGMENTVVSDDKSHVFTLSIGVSHFPGDGKTPEDLIHVADQALYRAKKRGRNCVEPA